MIKLQLDNMNEVRHLAPFSPVSTAGFSVIEVILAVVLFVIFSGGAITVVLQGLDANRLGEEQMIATHYASEGIEAARSIKNQNFANLANSVATGLTQSGGVWTFSGSNNILSSKFTRVLTVSDVQRDGSGNVVASGGTVDPLSKKVTSTVSWNFAPTRSNEVALTTYFTDFRSSFAGSWLLPSQQSTVNLAGNGNGVKVAIQGNYAYVVRTIGSPNFYVIDIADLNTPTIVGSLNLSSQANNVIVSGNYAYVSSTDNASELQVVNISTPSTPVLAGTFNAAGNANANAAFLSGSTLYLVRDVSSSPEFYAINVSSPSSPTQLGTLESTGSGMDVVVLGSTAYVASAESGTKLVAINVSSPSSPTQTSSTTLSGAQSALSIAGFGSTVLVGRAGGELAALNVSNPASPGTLGTYNASSDVNDISVNAGNTQAYLATSNSLLEFQVVNITSPAAMIVAGSLNMSANQLGVFYSDSLDRVFIVGAANTPEFAILQPS